jgi:hypothetical protein
MCSVAVCLGKVHTGHRSNCLPPPQNQTASGKICDSSDRNVSHWRGPAMFYQRLRTSEQMPMQLQLCWQVLSPTYFPFICFSVQGTGGSPTGPDPEGRVADQDSGSPGRPVFLGCKCSVSRFIPDRAKNLSASRCCTVCYDTKKAILTKERQCVRNATKMALSPNYCCCAKAGSSKHHECL